MNLEILIPAKPLSNGKSRLARTMEALIAGEHCESSV